MPIKELLMITIAAMASIFVTHPVRFQQELQKVKVRILREVGRTNGWGNPSIFRRDLYLTRRGVSVEPHLRHGNSETK